MDAHSTHDTGRQRETIEEVAEGAHDVAESAEPARFEKRSIMF